MIHNPSSVYAVSMRISQDNKIATAIVIELLKSLGFCREEIVEFDFKGKHSVCVYPEKSLQAKYIGRALGELKIPGKTVTVRRVKRMEWQEKWKKEFKPFKITPELTIVPMWLKKTRRKRSSEIYIDTTLAFGSGLHETTRLMAGLIREKAPQVETLLDIGTGTGILALIAWKSGVTRCSAVEIDKDAALVARRNFKANNFKVDSLKSIDIKSVKRIHKFDFVAANLVTHDLVRLKRFIIKFVAPKKYLAVSGISLENLPVLLKKFKDLPLKRVKIAKGKEWSAVLFQTI